jgi:hypothetical protein
METLQKKGQKLILSLSGNICYPKIVFCLVYNSSAQVLGYVFPVPALDVLG